MNIILIILRHYIFCLVGASLRFIFNYIFQSNKNNFNFYCNNDLDNENEMINSIIGFIFIIISISIILNIK